LEEAEQFCCVGLWHGRAIKSAFGKVWRIGKKNKERFLRRAKDAKKAQKKLSADGADFCRLFDKFRFARMSLCQL
jgi:hypothetical protein